MSLLRELSGRAATIWRSTARPPLVAAATLAVGVPTLRAAITAPRGSATFRRRTIALAAIWTVGALAARQPSQQPDQAHRPLGRDVGTAALAGTGLVAVFAVGAVIGTRISFMRSNIAAVVDHARRGEKFQVVTLALLTGAAEELYFRGAGYDVAAQLGLPPVPASTVLHAAATAATGNPMLVLASLPLSVVAGIDRDRTSTVVGPVIIHVVWSTGMLLILPPLLTDTRPQR